MENDNRSLCVLLSMSRIMAIDYGTKRVGLAVTDPLQIIAGKLGVVHSKDLVDFIKQYTSKEKVSVIVVGEPKTLDNKPTDSTRIIDDLVINLQRKFPDILIERQDERFTSKIAFQTMIDSGLKKKDRQNKELIDETSAVLILQSYMERKKNNF